MANFKFEFKDIVQQIISVLFASPFIVTEELTHISNKTETNQWMFL